MLSNPPPKAKPDSVRRMACLKAVADENRLAILGLLNGGDMCVCDIWSALELPQNLVSHHLAVLKRAGLVMAKKDGLKVIYSTNPECLKKLRQALSPILNAYEKP